ncbi:hypothetical protein [Actinoplanes sp. ATCC 53533]|nr:hypothetical protein [Actinoplanes sp. ATCC 53533]
MELTDEAATFGEQHPDIIARLAGQAPGAEPGARAARVRSGDPE